MQLRFQCEMRNFLSLTILVPEFFHFACLSVFSKAVILALVHLADTAISPVPSGAAFLLCCSVIAGLIGLAAPSIEAA